MAEVITQTPMQYLDKAVGALRDVGLMPAKLEPAPINALLEKISDLEPDKIQVIARTLGQASVFNEVVREQIAGMEIGERYNDITAGFNSIRDDAKRMVDQLDDSKLDVLERATNVWMKIARGDIADRFDKVKGVYLEVTKDTKVQIDRELLILEAYRDYRGALKQAEVLALEVLATATDKLEKERQALNQASETTASFAGKEPADRARLELARDEQLRRVQDEEKRYQIAKDLSDNLTISYNTSEVVMARLLQTTNAKERIYAQSVSFFSTNDSVLTALKASFTGMFGLHELTADAELDEGRPVEVAGDAVRDRRQGADRGGEGRIRPDHSRRRGEEAGRFRGHLPGALAADHPGDAHARDPELGRDPRRGRRRQAADGQARRRRQGAAALMATAEAAAAAPATATAAPAKLDDLMLAMDVVDTLRHRERLVERELNEDVREEQLIERLRELYQSQGIEVTDDILAQGVAALKESRFVYAPPPPSFGRTLATLWVKRATWGKWLAGALAALVLAVAAYQFGVVGPRERAAEATRVELAETLPRQLAAAHQAVTAEAKVPVARERADAILAEGRAALDRGNAADARAALANLDQLAAGAAAGIRAPDRRAAGGPDRLLPRASEL